MPGGRLIDRAGAEEDTNATGDLDVNVPLSIEGVSRDGTEISAAHRDHHLDISTDLTLHRLTMRTVRADRPGPAARCATPIAK